MRRPFRFGLLVAGVSLIAICAIEPVAAQQPVDAARKERIEQSLSPAAESRRDDADYINRIITMEINGPDGPTTVKLNYNHSIDLAVYYEFDSAQLTEEAEELLLDLGLALKSPKLAGRSFLMAGHTDARGREAYNQDLSERRAIEARRFLTERFGLPPSRLVAVGFGETRLADPNRPNDGINRRVEITLIEEDAEPQPDLTSDAASDDSDTGDTGGSGADDGFVYLPRTEPPVPVRVDPAEAASSDAAETETPSGSVAATDTGRPAECDGVDPSTDPRPAQTGLDDFGGRRTAVPCGPDGLGETPEPDTAANTETPDPTGSDPSTDEQPDAAETEAPPVALPSDAQNAAIGN